MENIGGRRVERKRVEPGGEGEVEVEEGWWKKAGDYD